MNQILVGAPALASLEDVQDVEEPDAAVDPVGILRELALAWKSLAL